MISCKVRHILILLTSILVISPLYSSDFRIWEPHDGKVVRSSDNVDRDYTSATDENGHVCVVWSDTRLDSRDIWAQLYSADGTELWDDGGKLITNAEYGQEDPVIKYLGNGAWGITWLSYLFDSRNEIYIQKLDMDGNLLWNGETGILVSTTDNTSYLYHPMLVEDNSGGVFSFYHKKIDEYIYIFAQHFNTNGVASWQENGVSVACVRQSTSINPKYYYNAVSDESGNAIVAWHESFENNPQIKANKLSIEGDLIWSDSSGVVICSVGSSPIDIKCIDDGLGGAFITWLDTRYYQVPDSYILYVQHINNTGEISLEINGLEVIHTYGPQNYYQVIKSDIEEAIFVTAANCEEYYMYIDVYAQKIHLNNNSLEYVWGSGGICVLASDFPYLRKKPSLSSDLQNGAYVGYMEYRSDDDNSWYSVVLAKIEQNGSLSWQDSNGRIICNRPIPKYRMALHPISTTLSSVLWIECPNNNTTIYHQIVPPSGNTILQENGDQLITGMIGNVQSYAIMPSSNNNYYVFWNDDRYYSDHFVPFIQSIDGNTGEMLLEDDGVCLVPSSYDCTIGKPVNNLHNSFFQPYRNGGLAYVQKFDDTGSILWGDAGSCVVTNSEDVGIQTAPGLKTTQDGGIIAIYDQRDDNNRNNIHAQRFDSSGNRLWPAPNGDGIRVVNDAVGLASGKFQDGSILEVYRSNSDYYAQKILTNGEIGWEDPVPICLLPSNNYQHQTFNLGGNILILWEDHRTGASNSQIYGQVICPDGSLLFQENGIPLINSEYSDMSRAVIIESEDSFWMTWVAWNPDFSTIYIQRFSNQLVPQLVPESGIQVCSGEAPNYSPIPVSDGNGGLYVLWYEEYNNGINRYTEIRFNHFDDSGNYVNEDYSLEGHLLSQGPFYRNYITATSDNESGFIAAWTDARKSTPTSSNRDIYIQRVNDWTVSVENTPDVIPAGWSLENAYPNPFNPSTKIAFNVGNASNVTLTVYDILGREVIKLVDGRRDAGNHIINWNGTNATGSGVASGTYFYRLEADDVMITKKMILMK